MIISMIVYILCGLVILLGIALVGYGIALTPRSMRMSKPSSGDPSPLKLPGPSEPESQDPFGF